ncbi:hypothetical protein [Actinoplanes sp. NPDC020271]|uniref:hypothetical protein n=1 Tax=Actinoplanes sp. NPDC020271 TaxID=3363896 RepID=UPI00379E8719
MLESQFGRLRSEVADAVRQPDFSTVRSRAGQVRRRRARTSAASILAVVLGVTGAGFAVQTVPTDRGLADTAPAPAPTESPGGEWFPSTQVTNAGTTLYRVFERCRDCDSELWASSDSGRSWQRRPSPPAPGDVTGPRTATLLALAPGLLVWRDQHNLTTAEVQAMVSGNPSGRNSPADRPWITRDGGMTWQQATVDTRPATAVPDGVQPVDCALFEVTTCRIGAIDPVTGRFAPLAAQPTGIIVQERWRWTDVINVPLDGRLWVPGLDPVSHKPAIATSADSGRTWHTHVFTGAATVELETDGTAGTYYLPKIAASSGATAYVLTYRADGIVDAHYTADGGLTWRDEATIRDYLGSTGFVTADGSHILPVGTGLVAGHGNGAYTPVELPGYPGDGQTPQVASRHAAVPYLVNSDAGPYLSDDGRTWRLIRLP